MKRESWAFDVPPNEAVVTTSYVTRDRMPILYVSHEVDEEGGVLWQFHCGNGDYEPTVLQLVGLNEILQLDPGITALATLPLGHKATRVSQAGTWLIEREVSE